MDGETVTINGDAATVVCADVPTANATVHLIDSVLMPPADGATTGDDRSGRGRGDDGAERPGVRVAARRR